MKVLTKCLLISFISILVLASCKKENPFPKPPTVDAGNSQTIQLPTNSVSLTGTVESNGNMIVGYLWSKVSGPNVPVIVSESSTSTLVEGLVSGVYVFQLMAIAEDGLTGVDTVSVTVTPSSIITLNLHPVNNPTEAHILGNGSDIDQSTPDSRELSAAYWTYGGKTIEVRAALQFDLSSIPANAEITSAKLTLYSNPNALGGNHVSPNAGNDNALYIERITASWNAGTVNWNNQPPTTNTDHVSIASTTLPSLDLEDIDVTKLTSEMVKNTNYGFMIRLQNKTLYNSRIFCSSKYPEAAKHPKLVVTYKLK